MDINDKIIKIIRSCESCDHVNTAMSYIINARNVKLITHDGLMIWLGCCLGIKHMLETESAVVKTKQAVDCAVN